MFFLFNQNNSGGSFHLDKSTGITCYVIVEASNADEANRIAESLGIYFDGCDTGQDCECCGDRWYPVDSGDYKDSPEIYGKSVFDEDNKFHRIEEDGFNVAVHYKDGSIKWA
jgi:hypothetical protein